jgi:predicted DCC family thiol-disulfide oxidoreductase YuxK
VNFAKKNDKKNSLKFFPNDLMEDKGFDIKNTVIVNDGNKNLEKSEAVILMLDKINFKKTSLFIKIFPTFIRNLVYDFIARYRYNIFGKINNYKNGN